jgi:PAS domain S-box-containing protein
MARAAFTTQMEGFDRRVRALIEAFEKDVQRGQDLVVDKLLEELSTSLEELKVAEEELAVQNRELEATQAIVEAERRRYHQFFMTAPEGYLLTDEKGTIGEGNHAAARLLGTSLANLVGKPLPLFVVHGDHHEFQQWLAQIQDREMAVATRSEFRVQTMARNRTFPCAFSFWRTDGDDAHRQSLRWSMQDLSDRERARERDWFEEQAVRKDEFLALLGHELRNPLAAIALAGEVLTQEIHPEAGRKGWAAQVVRHHCTQLSRLVNDLLDVSRVYHGKIKLSRRVTYLADVVAQAIETVQPLFRQKRHEVAVDRGSEPLRVLCDPLRMQQVLVNLLDNAAKYTPEGGRVEVRLRRSGQLAVVAVRDFGVGIPPGLIDRIFGLFEQGSPASGSGLGIGLALVRELVKMHDGTIEAHSAGTNQGSEFIINLPLVERPPVAEEAAAGSKPEPMVEGGVRLLIVDDNHDAADLIGMALEELGHEVRVAYTARAAEEAVAGCSFALVDLGMPDIDGFRLAPRLRSLVPGLRLIALTGFGDDRNRAAAQRAGFHHYVLKPVDMTELDALLRSGPAPRAAATGK